jgi:hypothetical protein
MSWAGARRSVAALAAWWSRLNFDRFCFYHWPALASHLTVFFMGTVFFSDQNQGQEDFSSYLERGAVLVRSPSFLERKFKKTGQETELSIIVTREQGRECKLNQERMTLIRHQKMLLLRVKAQATAENAKLMRILMSQSAPSGLRFEAGNVPLALCDKAPMVSYEQ